MRNADVNCMTSLDKPFKPNASFKLVKHLFRLYNVILVQSVAKNLTKSLSTQSEGCVCVRESNFHPTKIPESVLHGSQIFSAKVNMMIMILLYI